MISPRRRAVIEEYRAASRSPNSGRARAAWRMRNREAERVNYWLRCSIMECRSQVEAWDEHSFGVPLSALLAAAFGKKRSPGRRLRNLAGITPPSSCNRFDAVR